MHNPFGKSLARPGVLQQLPLKPIIRPSRRRPQSFLAKHPLHVGPTRLMDRCAPFRILSLPNYARELAAEPLRGRRSEHFPPKLSRTLKLMLPSYLDEGVPTITEIAEMSGHQRQELSTQALKHGPIHIRDWSMWFDLRTPPNFSAARMPGVIDVAFSSRLCPTLPIYPRFFSADFPGRRRGNFANSRDHDKPLLLGLDTSAK